MHRVVAVCFLAVAVAGAVLLLAGIWIFWVSAEPAPATMVCGALASALTWLSWRAHLDARAIDAND